MLGLLGLYAYVLVTAPYKLTSTIVEFEQPSTNTETNTKANTTENTTTKPTTITLTGNVTYVGTKAIRTISKHNDNYVRSNNYSLMPNWSFAYKFARTIDPAYISIELYSKTVGSSGQTEWAFIPSVK